MEWRDKEKQIEMSQKIEKTTQFWRGSIRLYCLRTAPEFQIQSHSKEE